MRRDIPKVLREPRAWLAMTMLAASFLSGGCASSNEGKRMKANVQTFQKDMNPDRLVALGKGFAAVGDTTRAEQYFSAALERGGDDRKIIPLILRVCIQDARYRVAIQYAEGYLRKRPDDSRTRFVLATLYAGVGENVAARAELERVLAVRPDDADAHFALAVLMRDIQEDPVAADPHFREYLRLKPAGEHAEEAQSSLLKSVP